MITLACLRCNVGLRTYGDEAEVSVLLGPESEFYPDQYPCPTDGCGGRAQYLESIDPTALSRLEIHDVTPQEAFAALNGLGFPPERDCGETAVRQALTRKITDVGVRQVRGANRSVLEWIDFEDGTRLYLASSSDGAVVYRLARRFSYVEQLP